MGDHHPNTMRKAKHNQRANHIQGSGGGLLVEEAGKSSVGEPPARTSFPNVFLTYVGAMAAGGRFHWGGVGVGGVNYI